MNLLSEALKWITSSEFVDPEGNISRARGETLILFTDAGIENRSWAELNGSRIENRYKIKKITPLLYEFESHNPALGLQRGTFRVDRHIIYSKFTIEKSDLNGYEVIIRNQDLCHAYGALYSQNNLINTWTAKMERTK